MGNRHSYSICVRGRLVELNRPLVMGILNVTPDSFYAASRAETGGAVVARARQMMAEGADIIDIGACSTRPGGDAVDCEEETLRLQRAVVAVREALPDAVISVDTFRPAVARRCVEEWGADMINDVGMLPAVCSEEERQRLMPAERERQEEMFRLVAELHVPYILMSAQPTIERMLMEWAEQLLRLNALGVTDVILDPGFGFGKSLHENYQVLAGLKQLTVVGRPLLVGLSRKSMIWRKLGITPDEALNGTTVLNTLAIERGANILRVHDVREAVEAVALCAAAQS